MQIMLGDKIKELRKRDGRKQDDLATALGVTNQAISRWESNKGYPDMEMIPAIANYFHVTIDELFGYDSDRNLRLSELLCKADAMNKPGVKWTKQSVDKLVSLLREALAEFPNEWKLQFRLSVALQVKSAFTDKSQKAKEESLREAAELLKQAKVNTEDSHWKDTITQSLARIYYQLGDTAQVEKIAAESSPAYVCREIILTNTPDADKAKEYTERALLSLIHEAVFVLVKRRMDNYKTAFADRMDLCLSFAKILESVLNRKQYGFFHSDMCFLYLDASKMSAKEGKEKEAIKYFDKAYEHILGFKDAWDRKGFTPDSEEPKTISDYPGLIVHVNENLLREYINIIPEEIAEKIRKSSKYQSVFG
ncbi:MAG: helix-turn-helix domain-containing protein [Lachnospiraceae bacterium]|nr:helix-turn-helix domain-containing protein [Lachnospiraceae bacterium]